jgi:hypothetical protein
MAIGSAIGATHITVSSYSSTVTTTTTPPIVVATVGTIITNNRLTGYDKTTTANQTVTVGLEVGLNTLTFKEPGCLPIVLQFHRT